MCCLVRGVTITRIWVCATYENAALIAIGVRDFKTNSNTLKIMLGDIFRGHISIWHYCQTMGSEVKLSFTYVKVCLTLKHHGEQRYKYNQKDCLTAYEAGVGDG